MWPAGGLEAEELVSSSASRPPAGLHCTTRCIAHSNAPEDGQNNCPKHVELIGIINKQLLLHLICLSSLLSISMMYGQTNIKLEYGGIQ
jgi:hypothetical protein